MASLTPEPLPPEPLWMVRVTSLPITTPLSMFSVSPGPEIAQYSHGFES